MKIELRLYQTDRFPGALNVAQSSLNRVIGFRVLWFRFLDFKLSLRKKLRGLSPLFLRRLSILEL